MLAPVVDPKTGATILYDIFVHGDWVGSRRTIAQCIKYLTYLRWPTAVLANHYRIEQGSPAKIIFDL